MPQLRERPQNNELTTCNAQFLLIHHRVLFYFRPVFDRAEHRKCSGRNIYAVGIAIVCIERYSGTFYIFSFSALRFSFSPQSGFVSFRRSRVGSSTAQRKYFLCGFECIAERYIKAYIETRQTKRTPTGQTRDFSTLRIDFCLRWRRRAPQRLNDERKAWRSRFILSSLRLFFSFALKHIKITSSIDSIQSQTVTVEFKNIGAKMMKISLLKQHSLDACNSFDFKPLVESSNDLTSLFPFGEGFRATTSLNIPEYDRNESWTVRCWVVRWMISRRAILTLWLLSACVF